jgi:hypothetical protein
MQSLDFTPVTFIRLAKSLQEKGYAFQTLGDFVRRPAGRSVILRHDVDALPDHSRNFSRLQKELGIRGTYFFRTKKGILDPSVIASIVSMDHEIGYHYEDLSSLMANGKMKRTLRTAENEREIVTMAMEEFLTNLGELRKYADVRTICMHGSPLSRWDSRLLWKYFDYRDLGIIAEPYLDLDYSKLLYLTDTGRRWDGRKFSVRDKLTDKSPLENDFAGWKRPPLINSAMRMSPGAEKFQGKFTFRNTYEIISEVSEESLPDNILLTFHPQRWTTNPVKWTGELLAQNVKNIAKYGLNILQDK